MAVSVNPSCAPFITAISLHIELGERSFIMRRRKGNREVRHEPYSEDVSRGNTRNRSAQSSRSTRCSICIPSVNAWRISSRFVDRSISSTPSVLTSFMGRPRCSIYFTDQAPYEAYEQFPLIHGLLLNT